MNMTVLDCINIILISAPCSHLPHILPLMEVLMKPKNA